MVCPRRELVRRVETLGRVKNAAACLACSMQVERRKHRRPLNMTSIESSPDTIPIPALLVERATALARAEAGLALVHTRRIAVRAVSALLGTIVACAFIQLTLILLVTWPVLAARVPLVNLLLGLLASGLLGIVGAAFAVVTWVGVARERRGGAPSHPNSPGVAVPRAVASEATVPQATVHQVTAPQVTAPQVTAPQSTLPTRVAARGQAPERRAPRGRPPTIDLAERASS